MAQSRKPSNGRLAGVALGLAAVASLVAIGFSPDQADASVASQGTVSISPTCYDLGFGSILAVLTSPLGMVQGLSGSLSAWVQGPPPGGPGSYGGQVSMTQPTAALVHVYPGTYDVQLSAHDAQGTTFTFSGTVVIPACDDDVVGIRAEPNPNDGYATFTDGAAVLSDGPNHASDTPSPLATVPHAPIVGMEALSDPSSPVGVDAYYFAAADGGVFAVDAPFFGSAAGLGLTAPIVAMALTPDHGGYWLVGVDGGVFAFGDAGYHGSMGGLPLNQPIVGMAVDQATGGYWLVSRDGGVFAFDAPFDGAAAALHLDSPVVGMESAPDGTGYRLVASDGGVFSYDEPFYGSMAGQHLAEPVVGIAEDTATGGYWIAGGDGGVFAFDAPFYGAEGKAAA